MNKNRESSFAPDGKTSASKNSVRKIIKIWTTCDWNYRTNIYFPKETREIVFLLMCIKYKLNDKKNISIHTMLKLFDMLYF